MSAAKINRCGLLLAALLIVSLQPGLSKDPAKMNDLALLSALASARYEKEFPAFARCPQNFGGAKITFDDRDSENSDVDEEYVRNALNSYYVRNGEDWRNAYAQDNGGITGHIILPDHTKLRWIIRDGGSALLLYPDGGVVYLAKDATPDWKTVAKSSWATLQVETKLYKKESNDRYFIHVHLTNTSDHTIAFDASKRASIFYPHQLGECQANTRPLVNENRIAQTPMTAMQTSEFLKSVETNKEVRNSSIVVVKPRDTYEYFISFNPSAKLDLEKTKAPFAILVMDGNMAFTDGQSVEQLKRDWSDQTECQVPIKTPMTLSSIPKSANILSRTD